MAFFLRRFFLFWRFILSGFDGGDWLPDMPEGPGRQKGRESKKVEGGGSRGGGEEGRDGRGSGDGDGDGEMLR